MSTTTIRIENDLKARVALAAERSGKTAHAFILDAIARTAEQVESDDDFHRGRISAGRRCWLAARRCLGHGPKPV